MSVVSTDKVPDTPPPSNVFKLWVCRSRYDRNDVRHVGLTQAECVNHFIAGIGGKRLFVSTQKQLASRNLIIVEAAAFPVKTTGTASRQHEGFWCLELDYLDANENDIIGVGDSWQATIQSAATNGNINPYKPKPPRMMPWPIQFWP